MKRVFFSVISISAGILLSIMLMESTLRFFQFLGSHQLLGLNPLRTSLTWIEDPEIGNTILKPNSQGWFVSPAHEYYNYIYVNSEGFYDSEHSFTKPHNTYRIILLGDSFVQSLQTPLNETFFALLEQKLKVPNKKVEVITMGMGNTGTAQQLSLLPRALKYHPDLVIQMFLTANDFRNNSIKLNNNPSVSYYKTDGVKLVKIPPQFRDNSFKTEIKQLRIVELLLFIRQKIQENIGDKPSGYPLDYHVYDKIYSSDFQESVDLTKKIIVESKKQSENSGAKYLLISLANNEQVNINVWNQLVDRYPKLKDSDLNKPDNILTDLCIEKSVNCLFMYPYFKSYNAKNPGAITHYQYDGHWNQLGTKLAAQFLIENLQLLQ